MKAKQTLAPTRAEIKDIVCSCLARLQDQDEILLKNDVSERAITHKLAEYLQSYFADRTVDCEYNRNAEAGEYAPKRIVVLEDEIKRKIQEKASSGASYDELMTYSTYPDIIVHHRGDNDDNLLIIEVKKMNNREGSEYDFKKLKAFTEPKNVNPYHYKFGISITLDTGWLRDGRNSPSEPVIVWCIDGTMEKQPDRCKV